MPDLKELCNHLRSLGEQPLTEDSRAEVEAALGSKWPGVPVVATRVLAKWGDRPSIELLKKWIVYGCERRRYRAVLTKADLLLAMGIEPQDLEWFLDLYFSSGLRHCGLFLYTPSRFPYAAMRARIEQESQHPDWIHRRAALWLTLRVGEYPATHQMFEVLANDPV